MTIQTVTSADGTKLAFEVTGEGPALVLVGGAFCGRSAPSSGTPLAALLAQHFRVYSYDRRGRGDSHDTPPWSPDRELEDLAALIAAAGGSAFVFGNSSGGLLALDAAAKGQPISKLICYEPPVILAGDRMSAFERLAIELDEAVADQRRAEAVELYFSQVMQLPDAAVTQLRKSPGWPGLEQLAHTLSYDLRITAMGSARLRQLAAVHAASELLSGEASPAWLREAVQTMAAALPRGTHRTLAGQTHAVDPKALAAAIVQFLV